MSDRGVLHETYPFPEERDIYADYIALRETFYPAYYDAHSESPVEASEYWKEIKELYTTELEYSPEAFERLSGMAFSDIKDVELLRREVLNYVEVQRRMFSNQMEIG